MVLRIDAECARNNREDDGLDEGGRERARERKRFSKMERKLTERPHKGGQPDDPVEFEGQAGSVEGGRRGDAAR